MARSNVETVMNAIHMRAICTSW